MITEQLLSELAETMELYPSGTHAVFVESKPEKAWMLHAQYLKELIRLARLGIWAEKYAIPTFKDGHNWACSCCDSNDTVTTHCDDALAQLPKQGEE